MLAQMRLLRGRLRLKTSGRRPPSDLALMCPPAPVDLLSVYYGAGAPAPIDLQWKPPGIDPAALPEVLPPLDHGGGAGAYGRREGAAPEHPEAEEP